MSIKSRSDLNAYVDLNFDANGAQLITGPILNAWAENINDSAINKLGDTGILGTLTYASLFSLSNDGDLVYKKYVDDLGATYLPLSAGSGKPLTGDLYIGSHSIISTNTNAIQNASNANNYLQVASAGVVVSSDTILTLHGDTTVDIQGSNGYRVKLDTSSLTANRAFKFADYAFTMPASNAVGFLHSDGAGTYTWASAGTGTVTSVSSANGDLTVATGTTTPVLTIVSAPKLSTARTIGGVSFDGTANITVASATGGFTISGGDLALGANNITITGSIGATGARVTKGWFTDLQVTNAIAGSITGNAATATALQTGRTINGTTFDGTSNITITAAAGTLTGTTLNSTVVTSSLTSVGTLTGGTTGTGFTISLTNSTISGLLTGTNGGTGVNNGSKTITLGGNLTTTGAFNATFAVPQSTTWTLPNTASETLAGLGTAQAFTAVQTFSAGSVGTPSIQFTGAGTNTGIYSTTTNDIRVATNGTIRVTISNSGFISNAAATFSSTATFNGQVFLAESQNIAAGTTTGTKIFTATTQKGAFWNATPIVQPSGANQVALTDSTTGTPSFTLVDVGLAFSQANINNNFASVYRILNEYRNVLVNTGLMKGAA